MLVSEPSHRTKVRGIRGSRNLYSSLLAAARLDTLHIPRVLLGHPTLIQLANGAPFASLVTGPYLAIRLC
jgi:hypothetical protein